MPVKAEHFLDSAFRMTECQAAQHMVDMLGIADVLRGLTETEDKIRILLRHALDEFHTMAEGPEEEIVACGARCIRLARRAKLLLNVANKEDANNE